MRGTEGIELAPKEFGILEYMMRNKGRPLSRTMIVEHVWDMDYDGLTNIVDVYIRHLRSKIDDRFRAEADPYGSRDRIHDRGAGEGRGAGQSREPVRDANLSRFLAEAFGEHRQYPRPAVFVPASHFIVRDSGVC